MKQDNKKFSHTQTQSKTCLGCAEPREIAYEKRTLAELEKAYLSDDSVAEFDKIVRKSESRRHRPIVWGAVLVAAASLALFLTLNLRNSVTPFNGIEMAEGIQHIMDLDTENIKSVTATPKGNKVILIALMKDGSQCSYMMSRANGAEAVSITAMK